VSSPVECYKSEFLENLEFTCIVNLSNKKNLYKIEPKNDFSFFSHNRLQFNDNLFFGSSNYANFTELWSTDNFKLNPGKITRKQIYSLLDFDVNTKINIIKSSVVERLPCSNFSLDSVYNFDNFSLKKKRFLSAIILGGDNKFFTHFFIDNNTYKRYFEETRYYRNIFYDRFYRSVFEFKVEDFFFQKRRSFQKIFFDFVRSKKKRYGNKKILSGHTATADDLKLTAAERELLTRFNYKLNFGEQGIGNYIKDHLYSCYTDSAKFVQHPDYDDETRIIRMNFGKTTPLRVVKQPYSDIYFNDKKNLELFRFRFNMRQPTLGEKPIRPTTYLTFKQKRYTLKNNINNQLLANGNGEFSTNPFLKNKNIIEENISNPAKQYKLLKKAKNRAEKFNVRN